MGGLNTRQRPAPAAGLRAALAWGVFAWGVLAGWLAPPALAAGEAVAAAPTAAGASAPATIPARAFFDTPRYTSANLSPDGRHLALTAARGDERLSLFVMDLQAPQPVARQTRAAQGDVLNVRWLGHDRLLFVTGDLSSPVNQRLQPGGSYLVGVDGGRPQRLMDDPPPVLQVSPRAGAEPADRRVIVGEIRRRPDGRLQHVQPQWLDLDARLPRPMDLPDAPQQVQRWLFDPQGQPRLAITEDEQGQRRLLVRRAPDHRWQPLGLGDGRSSHRAGDTLPWQPLAVDDSGRVLAAGFTEAADGTGLGQGRVAWVDPATGQLEAPALLTLPGFEPAVSLIHDADSGALVGLRAEAELPQQHWLDAHHAAAQAAVDRRLPGRFNTLQCRRCGTPQAVWLVDSRADTEPGELWLRLAATGSWRLIARRMPQIAAAQMAPQAFEWLRARDGRPLPVWLTLPAAVEQGRSAPAVVLVHGGPWVRGGWMRWEAQAQFLASRGYLVIAPDFRGSLGYGPAHFRAGWKQWGQAMQDDLADALLWARQRGLADARACIVGDSYGGYAALMGPVRHPGLYRCVVAGHALTDLGLLLEGHWLVTDDTSERTREKLLPQRVGDAVRDAAMLRANSPVHQAARIDVPVLLFSGEADVRVPRAHLERLVDALGAAGRAPEWVRYPNEGHGLAAVDNRVDRAERLQAFLARHLLGAAAAAAPAASAAR